MIPIILLVILVVLFTKVIGLFAKAQITDALWKVYCWIAPSSTMKALRVAQHRAKQVHTERSNTSAKEEFARWAKLDREYLKLTSEVETLKKSQADTKSKFGTVVKVLLFCLTTGTKVVLRIKYRKAAVFWLPPGVFPYYLMWIMKFSSAPLGSVSVGIWLFIVDNSVSTLFSIVSSVKDLVLDQQQQPAATPTPPPGDAEKPAPEPVTS